MTPTELAAWKTEITTDPGNPPMGYRDASGNLKDHETIEKLIKSTDRTVPDDVAAPVLTLLDIPEYLAVMQSIASDAPAKREMLGHLFSMGEIEPARKVTRDVVTFIFGSTSETLKKVKRNKKGRRHEELGLPMPTVSEIADAILRT